MLQNQHFKYLEEVNNFVYGIWVSMIKCLRLSNKYWISKAKYSCKLSMFSLNSLKIYSFQKNSCSIEYDRDVDTSNI